jgi:hypothetical protein
MGTRCCTDCPDDKGTERQVHQKVVYHQAPGCTDCPDDKGTESSAGITGSGWPGWVAPIAPMTRGLKVEVAREPLI